MIFKKKTLGFIVLAFACLIWIAMPFIGFLNLTKTELAIYLPSLLIFAEVLFFIAIALLGKEYWLKIKAFIKSKWQNFKK